MKRTAHIYGLAATVLWAGPPVASCGSDSKASHPAAATGGGGGVAGFVADAGTGGLASGGTTGAGGASATDPNHCGQVGAVCKASERCVDGVCTCAPYHASCGGTCTLTSNDPANCGACGAVCAAPKVCAVGACVSTCAAGLSPCNGACVNLASDNANCGACGAPCGSGQGCVNGTCKNATVFKAPSKCAGGSGPPITVDEGSRSVCTGLLAQVTFNWGVCSCQDAALSQTLYIDGFDSLKGGYDPSTPQLGGGLGANGQVRTSNDIEVWGQLWAASATNGFASSAPARIHQELHVGGPVSAGTVTVDGNAYVSGNITGTVAIAGTLYQSPNMSRSNNTTYKTLVNDAPVTVPPPCACDAPIPVASIVAAHSTNNDNALVGLSPDVLNQASAPARIDLPCGNYYLQGFALATATTIFVHGRTALYIQGDIRASAPLTITLDPDAELDIFVSGTVVASSLLTIGSPNYPALTRVYVGGTAPLALSSNTNIAGNIWAGNAQVRWSSSTDMFGSLFAGDFQVSAPLRLHHDNAVVQAGGTCPPPGGVTPGSDGGTGCSTCADCGNQACVSGACGACTTDSQCCAPLSCINGTCIEIIR